MLHADLGIATLAKLIAGMLVALAQCDMAMYKT